ncbi:TetR/AcrR family transcriptional regulator [Actinacidiphila glaucinigra]|uniref:TetR/AcrR family transcriptional regulator n=1 Tax=Actinacidiphila glaucinigra TaxID=235986 RepID=UPI0033B5F718
MTDKSRAPAKAAPHTLDAPVGGEQPTDNPKRGPTPLSDSPAGPVIARSNIGRMSVEDAPRQERRLTSRGAVTRDRIVQAAADLFFVRGVNAVSLDDVRASSGTSKSQLYRHFADKDQLVHSVIELRTDQVLNRDRQMLERMNSIRALERWSDKLIHLNSLQDGAYGCALGSLVSARAAQDPTSRNKLADTFAEWQRLISAGLKRMQANGSLREEADPEQLATAVMAALQGGYLLAQTAQDVEPMRISMQMALNHVRSYVVD